MQVIGPKQAGSERRCGERQIVAVQVISEKVSDVQTTEGSRTNLQSKLLTAGKVGFVHSVDAALGAGGSVRSDVNN